MNNSTSKQTVSYRDKFFPELVNSKTDITDENIYLLSHSIGKMPLSTVAYVKRHFFDVWEQQTAEAWPTWLSAINNFQTALAKLFNSSATSFCPQANVSSGLTKVLASLPTKAGKNVIVYNENDFPSAGFVLQQARRLGFQLRMIDKSEDVRNPDVWLQALSDDVHSVFITHVHYNTSLLAPVGQVCAMAANRNITSIVDIAQSGGIIPIDLQQWNGDIVLGSSIKWLCGGPGAGFLWINPQIVDHLKPVDVGWFSHHNPFEFDINHFQYASDSAKFHGGTPSVIPYIAATNSIRLINDIGVDTVRAQNIKLTTKLISQIDPKIVRSPMNTGHRGGTIVLKFIDQAKIEHRLTDAKVQFDSRKSGIRLSPHIYNTEAEIDRVIDCLN